MHIRVQTVSCTLPTYTRIQIVWVQRGARVLVRARAVERARACVSKAPQGNERGAMGSKNPPACWNPCVSLLSMFLKLGFRFQTPFAPCRCLVGRCLLCCPAGREGQGQGGQGRGGFEDGAAPASRLIGSLSAQPVSKLASEDGLYVWVVILSPARAVICCEPPNTTFLWRQRQFDNIDL